VLSKTVLKGDECGRPALRMHCIALRSTDWVTVRHGALLIEAPIAVGLGTVFEPKRLSAFDGVPPPW
jgi:hypothetical protein